MIYKCENVAHDRETCPDFGKYTGRCMSQGYCKWRRIWDFNSDRILPADHRPDYERSGM